MIRETTILALAAAVAWGCSSAKPEVQTGPRPDAAVVLGGGADDSEAIAATSGANPNASTAARLGIPPGHLPPPGLCRAWMPGEPPGQQKKSFKPGPCSEVEREVPQGGWLVYRPSENKKQVKVWVYDARRPEVVSIRFFDIITGELLDEFVPAGD